MIFTILRILWLSRILFILHLVSKTFSVSAKHTFKWEVPISVHSSHPSTNCTLTKRPFLCIWDDWWLQIFADDLLLYDPIPHLLMVVFLPFIQCVDQFEKILQYADFTDNLYIYHLQNVLLVILYVCAGIFLLTSWCLWDNWEISIQWCFSNNLCINVLATSCICYNMKIFMAIL